MPAGTRKLPDLACYHSVLLAVPEVDVSSASAGPAKEDEERVQLTG